MVLSKYFSLFELNISLSKNIFILSVVVINLSGSNYLSLHMEIAFFFKSRAGKNFKMSCPLILTIVALYVALKQVNFFHTIFHDATLKN